MAPTHVLDGCTVGGWWMPAPCARRHTVCLLLVRLLLQMPRRRSRRGPEQLLLDQRASVLATGTFPDQRKIDKHTHRWDLDCMVICQRQLRKW